jgi:hypothetical protein
MAKPGLYANIHAKRKRIAAGSGEKMRTPGTKGAPTKQAFVNSAKTAKVPKAQLGKIVKTAAKTSAKTFKPKSVGMYKASNVRTSGFRRPADAKTTALMWGTGLGILGAGAASSGMFNNYNEKPKVKKPVNTTNTTKSKKK